MTENENEKVQNENEYCDAEMCAVLSNCTSTEFWHSAWSHWPWVTSDPDFDVTTFFDIDIRHLRNDTR